MYLKTLKQRKYQMKTQTNNKLSTLTKRVLSTAGVVAVEIYSTSAHALAGLDTATSTATEIKTGMYAFVGVGALIYLIYLALMAFTEKKTWADFGMGVVHVSFAGAALALGTWAWGLFA